MTDFWTRFAVGWAVGAIVASLAPRFFYWQTRRYHALRGRRRDLDAPERGGNQNES